MKVQLAIDIDAPPEAVWYWLGDPERAKTWMTSVGRTEYINRTADLVGSTFREYVQEGGRGTWLTGRIVAYVPNRRFAVHLEGDFNIADVVFTLQETAGGTRLTQTADLRFKGLLRLTGLIFGPAIKKNITRQSAAELAALKRLCRSSLAEDNHGQSLSGNSPQCPAGQGARAPMADPYRLQLTDKPDDAAHTAVGMGVHYYNVAQAGETNYRPLGCFLHDPEGEVVAGLIGATYWDWFYLDLLWVREDLRGQGHGRRLVEQAEDEARRRGAKYAYLDTFSFQAPAFYDKLGYQVFGQLPEFPGGHQRYFYAKTL
jgi:GNAT superfamily N-acetyltransferase/uncharacterized protein YndB with AHSA1/START domain